MSIAPILGQHLCASYSPFLLVRRAFTPAHCIERDHCKHSKKSLVLGAPPPNVLFLVLLGRCERVANYFRESRMMVFDVRLHPHTLPSLGAELCCSAAVRRPGYLPARKSMGFAPPSHDRFALLASAHGCACACRHILNTCYKRTIHYIVVPRNTPWRIFPAEGPFFVLLCVTLSSCPPRYQCTINAQ